MWCSVLFAGVVLGYINEVRIFGVQLMSLKNSEFCLKVLVLLVIRICWQKMLGKWWIPLGVEIFLHLVRFDLIFSSEFGWHLEGNDSIEIFGFFVDVLLLC